MKKKNVKNTKCIKDTYSKCFQTQYARPLDRSKRFLVKRRHASVYREGLHLQFVYVLFPCQFILSGSVCPGSSSLLPFPPLSSPLLSLSLPFPFLSLSFSFSLSFPFLFLSLSFSYFPSFSLPFPRLSPSVRPLFRLFPFSFFFPFPFP